MVLVTGDDRSKIWSLFACLKETYAQPNNPSFKKYFSVNFFWTSYMHCFSNLEVKMRCLFLKRVSSTAFSLPLSDESSIRESLRSLQKCLVDIHWNKVCAKFLPLIDFFENPDKYSLVLESKIPNPYMTSYITSLYDLYDYP